MVWRAEGFYREGWVMMEGVQVIIEMLAVAYIHDFRTPDLSIDPSILSLLY